MAISINHATKVVSIPKADTTFVGTNGVTGYEIRSYDEYALMRQLADYLDSEAGAALPAAVSHNTSVVISGVTYARTLSFLAPYTFTFENGTYQVRLIGGTNTNMLDVVNPNSVSVVPANSAGLQVVTSGSGLSGAQATQLEEIHKIHGLAIGSDLEVTATSRSAGAIEQTITEGGGTTTVSRAP